MNATGGAFIRDLLPIVEDLPGVLFELIPHSGIRHRPLQVEFGLARPRHRRQARKGVLVRKLSADDVRDICKLRRLFELSALDLAVQGHEDLQTAEISKVLAAAERAATAGDWMEVGTANLRFHALIVDIHAVRGSRRSSAG